MEQQLNYFIQYLEQVRKSSAIQFYPTDGILKNF